MSFKMKWSKLYLICLFIWAIVFSLSNETSFGRTFPWIYKANSILWLAIRLLLFCKIITCYRNRKDFIKAFSLVLIAIMVETFSNSEFLMPFFWFLAAGKKINVYKAVKVLWYAGLMVVSLVMILSFFGVIENVSSIRSYNAAVRYGYGFLHPNTLASKILQLCAIKLYLDKDKISVFSIGKVVLMSLITFILLDSRTALFLMLVLVMFAILYYSRVHKINFWGILSKKIILLVRFSVILLFLVSCFFTIYYNNVFSDYSSGNTLFSRFAQIYLFFNYYDLKIFGQELYVHGASNVAPVVNMYTLDNGYISLILGQGIVASIIFIILYIKTLRIEKKKNDLMGISILTIYAVYGFVETVLIRFSLNFSMLLMLEAFWKGKSENKVGSKLN